MKTERLIYMANQIANFFSGYPENEAVTGTAQHLRNFWDPRMRDEITRYVESGGKGLRPIAESAVRHLSEAKKPTATQSSGR